MASYRRLSTAGQVPYDGFGDVFLVVDGWGTIRSDFEEMEQQITQIAARGLGFGVHIALSIQRWMEIRPALRDLLSSRLELRLGDPTESDVDRRAAANVPTGSPGCGLSPNKLHFLAALPRIDGDPSTDNLVERVAAMVKRVASAWSGPPAPDVRLLPADLPIVSLPPIDLRTAAVPIGIDENTLPGAG
jgi:S-DNA-T family DNA segregation ATPase FtsK/SpoIIIE